MDSLVFKTFREVVEAKQVTRQVSKAFDGRVLMLMIIMQ